MEPPVQQQQQRPRPRPRRRLYAGALVIALSILYHAKVQPPLQTLIATPITDNQGATMSLPLEKPPTQPNATAGGNDREQWWKAAGFVPLQFPIMEDDSDGAFYSVARHDRSGSAIRDMLKALAYAIAKKKTYRGACYQVQNLTSWRINLLLRYRREHERIIRDLHLAPLLRFACPRDASRIVPFNKYAPAYNRRPEFLRYLQKKLDPTMLRNQSLGNIQVAVHVRRGDVTPCKMFRGRASMSRYLPNSHYMAIFDRYLPPNCTLPPHCTIHVYSEKDSYEPWNRAAWTKHHPNLHFHLDGPLADAWKHFITADYVILSRSSFSVIPAMLNPTGKVLYTRFNTAPLPGWTVVDQSIIRQTTATVHGMQEKLQCPVPDKKKQNKTMKL